MVLIGHGYVMRSCRYISQPQYDSLMERLKREFKDPPVASAGIGAAAMCLCMLTAGVCFCPCLYLKRKVDEFNLRLESVASAAVQVSSCGTVVGRLI